MFNREPAVILGLVGAAIALGVGFGLPVTPAQTGLIMGFVSAVLAVWVRSKVVPTEKANSQIETAIRMPSTATVKDVIAQEKKETGL